MKIKLAEHIEVSVKDKDALKKLKVAYKEEDARKQKIFDDIETLKNKDPELIAFQNMQLATMTPQEIYDKIDEEIEKWQ